MENPKLFIVLQLDSFASKQDYLAFFVVWLSFYKERQTVDRKIQKVQHFFAVVVHR